MSRQVVEVADAGLSVLYQPDSHEPTVDILFVHGLQGHPRKTWTCGPASSHRSRTPSPAPSRSEKTGRKLLGIIPRRDKTRLCVEDAGQKEGEGGDHGEVFWPLDLLPEDCPTARILTWGYNTIVTKGWEAANKSNIFAHAKNLLAALQRERPRGRPIIFVAHSLGGIVVKEVLRRSESSTEEKFKDIVSSTAAVVFLGTPHRGSPNFASFGDTVRGAASLILRMDSNSTILRALGVDSPELELSRESFVTLWRVYNFEVKTFQESLPLSGVNIGLLNELVVTPVSSSLDDPRENAETLEANHMEMCKFTGRNDPKYKQVGGELKSLVAEVASARLNEAAQRQAQETRVEKPALQS